MERLNSIITSYQQKICKHDRQIWEQSYETDLFKKLKNVPRKAAKINTSLIDVDLFRGSAFSVSKSQSGWLSIVTLAWLRLIFFPLCHRWWLHSTCRSVFGLLCILYAFQLSSLVVLYLDFQHLQSIETLTVADLITPYIMMYVLTVVHSLITANYNFPVRHSTPSSNGKRSKPSVIQSYQSHVLENVSRSDQMTDKKAKEESQNSLHSKHKESFLTGTSNASLAYHDFSAKMYESATEVVKKREISIIPKPSDNEQLLSGREHFQNSPSQIESYRMMSYSEFHDAFPRSASDLVRAGGVDHFQNENSRAGKESFDSVHSSRSMTADSLLTVVGSSFEEPAADAKCNTAEVQEPLDDERVSENVPEVLMNKAQRHPSMKSRCQKEMAERIDPVLGTSDDEETQFVLSKFGTNFEGRCLEVVSIADSNTSMSDTCNSSFVSSADDNNDDDDDDDDCGAEQTGACAARARNFSAVRDKKFKKLDAEFIGVRQRRNPAQNQSQSPVKRSPLRTFEGVHGSQHENANAFSRAEQRHRMAAEYVERGASSDEEGGSNLMHGVALRGSLLRQPVVRKLCASCQRKSETDSADEAPRADPALSLNARDSPQFLFRNGAQDLIGCDNRSQSLPFMKNVPRPDCDEVLGGHQSPFHRTSGQSGSEKSLPNAAGSTADALPPGFVPSSLINCITSTTDKVSCMIWSAGGAVHKVDLTILDIGWTIVRTVDAQQERCDYMLLGILLSFVTMFFPSVYRLYQYPDRETQSSICTYANATAANSLSYVSLIFGSDIRQGLVLVNGMIQRLCLSLLFFFLLSVAERTFKQKLLYAKYFCYLTSSRKAKKYDLPHFRLNKVRNIKTWLSLRSFLKKRGPQRSVESVVSSSFILAVILVSILCIELLQDYGHFLEHLGNWELVLWGMILGVYLLRFLTLGTKINKKYRNLSVLITEQINLYLHMEQKPHKKAALMVANSVLKLAEGLLKELESPFKISGLSANPFLYNITKVVILSAFSAVLTELLGFELKLYRIKIRS